MSKKYTQLATNIIEALGGVDNINEAYHCQTRLRFKLKKEDIVQQETIEQMEGVAKVIKNAGVFQVVIGTHVKDVFDEIQPLLPTTLNAQVVKEKKNIANTLIDFVAGTFQPVIPALSGAGMVKAVLALFVVFKWISPDSQTYYLLNMFADGVFYFLPMLLAFSEAQKLKCNPILAVSVAAIMMHPNWNALVQAGDPVHFFEVIPFTLTAYTSSVIPILIVVFVQSYVEKFLNRFIPKAVEMVFVPLLTFLIMGTLAFSILGPIGSIVGGYLATFFNFLSSNASWAPALLIGGFLPIMVMFGLHNGVAPLGVMQMADRGYDSIFGPGCVCSNIAQASAGLVVAIRTKDKKIKQLATSGSITAYMGITEPVLYGVNLPKKYPLIAAMIGGACGGLYAGLTQTHRFATGSSGLPAVLLYIGDDTMRFFYNILIALLISAVVSAVVTYILSLKYEKSSTKANAMSEDHMVFAPVSGMVRPLQQCNDEVFASESMGKGIVILPDANEIVSPVDGVVSALFPTHHAIGITTDDGIEVLIHIGIDTVDMKGDGFHAFVSQGQRVQRNEVLIEFDKEKIEASGYSSETIMIITNTNEYRAIEMVSKEKVTKQDPVLSVVKG